MMKDFSQNGESKILQGIFEQIGTLEKFAVEFGASDGYWLSNIRMFIDYLDWRSLQFECCTELKNNVKKEFITKDNINEIFSKHNVPKKFDLLSIDIDGNDYWVWKELNYEPSVVIIEYNSNFGHGESYALTYNPGHNFHIDGNAYSASLTAFLKLSESKGYFLHDEINSTNLIFVKNEFKDILNERDPLSIKLPVQNHKGKQIEYFTEI